jgi:hypothetical protein
MNVQTSGIADRMRATFPTVIKAPLHGPDGLTTEWHGLWRMDNHQAVGPGSVSARYSPHTSEDVIALVEAAEHTFGEVGDVEMGFNHGHFISVAPKLSKEKRLELYENDIVFPRLMINAPYGASFRANVGLFRIVCSNLYSMREVSGISVTFRHTHSLRSKMDELISDFRLLEHGWDRLSERVTAMTQAKTQVADFLDAIYGVPGDDASERSVTMHKNRTRAIITRMAQERIRVHGDAGDLMQATHWELFNAVQGYAQHTKSRKGNVSPVDRIILASEDETVRRAEKLLVSLAV